MLPVSMRSFKFAVCLQVRDLHQAQAKGLTNRNGGMVLHNMYGPHVLQMSHILSMGYA